MIRCGLVMSWVVALFPALSGCCLCDPDGHARALAGEDATDCGFVPLGEDREPALECADDAIASGAAFFVGFARQGRDSEVRTYLSGRADGTFHILGYDGDPSGGSGACERLVAFECTSAPERTSDLRGGEMLSCASGGDGVTLCDR